MQVMDTTGRDRILALQELEPSQESRVIEIGGEQESSSVSLCSCASGAICCF